MTVSYNRPEFFLNSGDRERYVVRFNVETLERLDRFRYADEADSSAFLRALLQLLNGVFSWENIHQTLEPDIEKGEIAKADGSLATLRLNTAHYAPLQPLFAAAWQYHDTPQSVVTALSRLLVDPQPYDGDPIAAVLEIIRQTLRSHPVSIKGIPCISARYIYQALNIKLPKPAIQAAIAELERSGKIGLKIRRPNILRRDGDHKYTCGSTRYSHVYIRNA